MRRCDHRPLDQPLLRPSILQDLRPLTRRGLYRKRELLRFFWEAIGDQSDRFLLKSAAVGESNNNNPVNSSQGSQGSVEGAGGTTDACHKWISLSHMDTRSSTELKKILEVMEADKKEMAEKMQTMQEQIHELILSQGHGEDSSGSVNKGHQVMATVDGEANQANVSNASDPSRKYAAIRFVPQLLPIRTAPQLHLLLQLAPLRLDHLRPSDSSYDQLQYDADACFFHIMQKDEVDKITKKEPYVVFFDLLDILKKMISTIAKYQKMGTTPPLYLQETLLNVLHNANLLKWEHNHYQGYSWLMGVIDEENGEVVFDGDGDFTWRVVEEASGASEPVYTTRSNAPPQSKGKGPSSSTTPREPPPKKVSYKKIHELIDEEEDDEEIEEEIGESEDEEEDLVLGVDDDYEDSE
ncbi:hypothetical protein E3N88_20596 [Mikania micrantha]|uniref:Uncharacterized protein n=1 Tax=Mikania micrantha TaxID=192012 RepID=A0A5N6NJB2_9ASTR|nr:hypothetical protein E3N88_20596 [Mikania micrantha]